MGDVQTKPKKMVEMNVIYGFALVLVVLVGCFSVLAYQTFELQTQVQQQNNEVQQQNNESAKPKIIVLSYSWIDEPYSTTDNVVTVNCTFLNISPVTTASYGVTIHIMLDTLHETRTTSWEIGGGGLGPWETMNEYNLTATYPKADGYAVRVWLILQGVQAQL